MPLTTPIPAHKSGQIRPIFHSGSARSPGKAALSLRGAPISAGGSHSETSSPPFAVTPAPPAPDLLHRPLPCGTAVPHQLQTPQVWQFCLNAKSYPLRLCPARPRAVSPRHSRSRARWQMKLLSQGTTAEEPLPHSRPGPTNHCQQTEPLL